jgi:hypothetical protein
MPRPLLHEPQWVVRGSSCLGCGYDLQGLAPQGACPECGMEFEPHALILSGIANRARGGSLTRRLAWIALIALGILCGYLWPVLFLFVGWVATLLVFILLAAGIAYMFITSPRERTGLERFCITRRGIVRLPLTIQKDASRDAQLIPWGDADAVTLDRVSPVWRRLRIGRHVGPAFPLTDITFDAGIRCPDDSAPIVQQTIREQIAGRRPTPQPPAPPARPPTSPT